MSPFPCLRCDAPISAGEAEQAGACTVCGQSLVVCERYRVTGLLGRGGVGAVYAARRISDGQEVAVKVVRAGGEQDWTAWSLFERSCQVLRGLHHTRLPAVYDFGRDARSLLLVRERFDGGTLEERIRRDQRLEPAAFRALVESLLELLGYLEGLVPPVVHRDIKPANIMFRSDESWDPVLVDFDSVAAPEGARSGVTIVGTPGYAAPEQFSGDASPASDLYSLGATILFVATHVDADQLPRQRGRFDVAKQIAYLPESLRRVLLRLVEPNPDDRYPDAAAALRDLKARQAAAPAPRSIKPPPAPPPGPQLWSLRRTLVFLGIAYAGVWGVATHTRHTAPTASSMATAPARSGDDPELRRYRRGCDRADASDCYNLGYRYDNGKGVEKNYARAAELYLRACDGGDSYGCNNLAVLYEHGRGVAKDLVRAAALYRQACDGKDWLACKNLGYFYMKGMGVARDAAQAESLFRSACDHGELRGCFQIGWMYDEGLGVPKDGARAAAQYRRACDGGNFLACANLGYQYSRGYGVPQDPAQTLALYRKSCDGNEPLGCSNLGALYEHGRGVEVDLARALQLYRGACDQDQALACSNLGELYLHGNGVTTDAARACELFVKSCQGENKDGCDNLSHAAAAAATREPARAALARACGGGNAWACQKAKDLGLN
jgi:TPR repeat protein